MLRRRALQVKRTSRMEQALGPRPGPGDAREVAALRLHVDHKYAQPHVEGHSPPAMSARNTSRMFQVTLTWTAARLLRARLAW